MSTAMCHQTVEHPSASAMLLATLLAMTDTTCLFCVHPQIKCHGVDYESSIYEPFMDLSLEIPRIQTVVKALQHFTAKELLDGDNKYRCPKNNKLVGGRGGSHP